MADKDKEKGLFAEPGHFYSPVTDREATRRYLKSSHYARQIARTDAKLDMAAMLDLWREIEGRMVVFPFEKDPSFRYYGRNNQFEYFDATILSGMIGHFNPRQIVEIGSGYSSAAMFDTAERMEGARLQRFVTIDPDLSRIKALRPPAMAELIGAEVQTVPDTLFAALEAGDLLFIDSSHVLKTGSDVHFEYLHILPALKPGVIVHIHDIFYPLDYPRGWALGENRSWNEVYLVDMMLTYGQQFEILFFNDAFLKKAADQVRRPGDMFARFESFETRPMHGINGSLWLRRR